MTSPLIIPRQLPIFDQVAPDTDLLPLPNRITTMHLTNGRNDGVNCGTCAHLLHNRSNGRTHYKCARYALSSADAADWRDYWPACGLWEQDVGSPARILRLVDRWLAEDANANPGEVAAVLARIEEANQK